MMNQTKATETGRKINKMQFVPEQADIIRENPTLFAFPLHIVDRFVIIGKFGTPYAPRAHTVIELLWMRRIRETSS